MTSCLHIRHRSPTPSSPDKAAILLPLALDLLIMYGVMARGSDAMTRGLHVIFRGDRGDSEVLWSDNIACSGLIGLHV
jgi:hypothetical protein